MGRDYIQLYKTGELQRRASEALELLRNCVVCPRKCRVNRIDGEAGVCGVGFNPIVSSFGPHFGEERCLVGQGGSGTIFFAFCNLKCVFCQNYDISQLGVGNKVDIERLAEIMVKIQQMGCHNVNLVSPTHFAPQILAALLRAVEKGFSLPLVYNTGGYDSIEILGFFDGIVDIYMPDIKFSNDGNALKFSGVGSYWDVAKVAVKEMHRQVGDLEVGGGGIAERGLLVRHLVLPNGLAGTREIMSFLAREISPNTYVNIMDQYHPCYKAVGSPELGRGITEKEFEDAIDAALEAGIARIDGRGGKWGFKRIDS